MTRSSNRWILSILSPMLALIAFNRADGAPQPPLTRADAREDPLPDNAVARLGTTRFRHGSPIRYLETSQDGKYVLTLGSDRLRIWQAKDGILLKSWELDNPWAIASFSPDGTKIAATFEREKVEIFPWASADAKHWSFGLPEPRRLCWSPDGKHIAMLGTLEERGAVQVSETASNKTLGYTFTEVDAVCFSADGKHLVMAKPKGELLVHNLADGKRKTMRADGAKDSTCTDLFPLKADTVGSIDENGDCRIWDIEHGKVLGNFIVAMPFAVSSKSGTLAAIEKGSLYVYDLNRRERIQELAGVGTAGKLALSPDGERSYVAGPGNALHIWNLTTGKDETPPGHLGEITGLAISDDGKTLFSSSPEAICQWDLTPSAPRMAAQHALTAYSLKLSPDNRRLVAGGTKSLQIWKLSHREFPQPLKNEFLSTISVENEQVKALSVSPDGKQIAFAGGLKKILVADLERGIANGEITFDAPPIAASHALHTRHLAVLTRTGRVHLCSLEPEPKLIWKKQACSCKQGAVAVSPDGLLVAVSSLGQVKLFEIVTGRNWGNLDRQLGEGVVQALAFSPDGRLLVVGHGGPRGIVRVWDVFHHKEVTSFEGQGSGISRLEITPDGRKIISGGDDSSILIWNMPSTSEAEVRKIDPQEAWENLDSDDSKTAYAAMLGLLRGGPRTLSVLEEGLKKIRVDQANYAKWIEQLDHDDFRKRKTARALLEKAGARAVPSLTGALNKQSKPEVERLLQLIVESLEEEGIRVPIDGFCGDSLRSVRAIYLLENLGGVKAIELLQFLAGNAQEARVKTDAAAALRRMK